MSSLFLYESCFSIISFYICQNIHLINIFMKYKIFKIIKNFLEFFFRMSSLFINNFFFLFYSENFSFNHCTVNYGFFDFRFFVFLYFNFQCFHYLNRSYGRFVHVVFETSKLRHGKCHRRL